MRAPVAFFALLIVTAARAEPSQWDHNGSIVNLFANGNKRQFGYAVPRPGLPVKPGNLVFTGVKEGQTYSGVAYVWSTKCGPAQYSVSGPVSEDLRTVTLYGKAPIRDGSCRVAGYRDDVLVFNFIDPAEPKQIVRNDDQAPSSVSCAVANGQPTLVCLTPEFAEEMKLMKRIDGNPSTTDWVAQAINYLREKYCVVVAAPPEATAKTSLGYDSGCTQNEGNYKGERVYWGECHE